MNEVLYRLLWKNDPTDHNRDPLQDRLIECPCLQGKRSGLSMISLRDFLLRYGKDLREYYNEDFFVPDEGT